VTISSGVSKGTKVELSTFPSTCVVVLKTLRHYRARVWLLHVEPEATVCRHYADKHFTVTLIFIWGQLIEQHSKSLLLIVPVVL